MLLSPLSLSPAADMQRYTTRPAAAASAVSSSSTAPQQHSRGRTRRPCICQAAAVPQQQQQQQQQQPPPPLAPAAAGDVRVLRVSELAPLQALKEWAPTIAALQDGSQTVLLRKGGIREPTFTPRAAAFLLFPTAFHSDAQLLKPGVAQRYSEAMALDPRAADQLQLSCFAEVTGAWTTRDARVLQALDAHHVYAPAWLDTRLKWRAQEPLTLLELRAWALEVPLALTAREELFGCFSWLALSDADVAAGGAEWRATPALSDARFGAQAAALRAALEGLQVEQLPLA